MIFDEEVAQKMLSDPRWEGAISQKMVSVWRTRNAIPNQYFNQKYVQLSKKGDPTANQVKDPFFNEIFVLRTKLTPAEIKEHDRVVREILKNEKINAIEVIRQVGIKVNLYNDAVRDANSNKFVRLRAEHVLAIKKNLQELRIKIKNLVQKLDGKTLFWERDKKEIDEIMSDERLNYTTIIQHRPYSSRLSSRRRKEMSKFENEEARHILDKLAIFLLETAM